MKTENKLSLETTKESEIQNWLANITPISEITYEVFVFNLLLIYFIISKLFYYPKIKSSQESSSYFSRTFRLVACRLQIAEF